MSEPKPIGGFFELEAPSAGPGYHPDACALANGRACLRWILEKEKPSRVYVPFYTCYALYEPMEKMGVEFAFYEVDAALDPVELPEPETDELLIIINFFGLKNELAGKLAERLGERVVIDDTHRFFHRGYQNSYSFTSARKYFGVPDGAYLYGANGGVQKIERNTDVSVLHNVKRLLGRQDEAYRDYLAYESSLGCELKRISLLSERLLSGVDYEVAAQRRIENFSCLHERLKSYNNLSIDPAQLDVPFCYPLLPDNHIEKALFAQQKLFIPTFWPDILKRNVDGFELEKDVTKGLLPLPVDQRYVTADMERIASCVMGEIH